MARMGPTTAEVLSKCNFIIQTGPRKIPAFESVPFDATFADPAFLEDAARQNLEIGAKSGEELQRMVTGLIETPPAVLEQVRRAIQIKSAEAIRGAGPGRE
jgi:hypothetical protein